MTEPPTETTAPADQARGAADEGGPPAGEAPRKRARGRETAGDMVRSLAVVLVLVGVVVAFNVADQPDPVVRDIDYSAALTQAREQAPYDVLAPEPLPAGWRATSARTDSSDGGLTWHLGLVTGSGDYAAVEQTDGSPAPFVRELADDAEPAGTVTLGGETWRRLEGGDPEPRALLRTDSGVTTLVAGSASWAELEKVVETLQP